MNFMIIECEKEQFRNIKSLINDKNPENIIFDEINCTFITNNYSNVIDVIANIIITIYEKAIIKNLLNVKYSYLNSEEIIEVYNECIDTIGKQRQYEDILSTKYLLCKLDEWRKENPRKKTLNLGGFVQFGLCAYVDKIEDVVMEIIDERAMRQESEEFISFLRYYIKMQTSQMDGLFVAFLNSSEYILVNENKIEITRECYQKLGHGVSKVNLTIDDMLISVLIMLVPKKIVFINPSVYENKEVLNTISDIFEDRVTVIEDVEIRQKEWSFNNMPVLQ